MKFINNTGQFVASLVLCSTLVGLSVQANAQKRDWDGGRDHSARDKTYARGHNWHSGAALVDYPDYSTWQVNAGLYPVASLSVDVSSGQPYRQQRAAFFGHASVNIGGRSFTRTTVNRNGKQYYAFKNRR